MIDSDIRKLEKAKTDAINALNGIVTSECRDRLDKLVRRIDNELLNRDKYQYSRVLSLAKVSTRESK